MAGAPAESRLGAIQRGRGAGYRQAAAAGAEAIEEVVRCVLDDPRVDRQVESRDDYFARLLIVLDAASAPAAIAAHLSAYGGDDDSATWLPIGTLVEMARRGSEPGRKAVRDLIGAGTRWRSILIALEAREALVEVVDTETIARLVTCVPPRELVEAMHDVDAPWATWAESVPALRFVLRRAHEDIEVEPQPGPIAWVAGRVRPEPPPVVDPTMSTDALLARVESASDALTVRPLIEARRDPQTVRALLRAAREGNADQRYLALPLLGARGRDDLVGEAEQVLRVEAEGGPAPEPTRIRAAWFRYLEALPAETGLPLAREWLDARWPLSGAAESIFARHAAPEDRARLEAACEAALRHELVYRLCSLVDALGHIGDPGSLDLFERVYVETRYSYARRRAVAALVRHDTDARVQPLLVEALWDCEPESRVLACRAVDRSVLPTRSRIMELAADPCEHEDVRAAAAATPPRASGD